MLADLCPPALLKRNTDSKTIRVGRVRAQASADLATATANMRDLMARPAYYADDVQCAITISADEYRELVAKARPIWARERSGGYFWQGTRSTIGILLALPQ